MTKRIEPSRSSTVQKASATYVSVATIAQATSIAPNCEPETVASMTCSRTTQPHRHDCDPGYPGCLAR
jgi:hypothetical protein